MDNAITLASNRLFKKQIEQGYTLEHTYPYNDESGKPMYWRLRFEKPSDDPGAKAAKEIRIMHQKADGTYAASKPEGLRLWKLFNLDKLTTDPTSTVYFVEGEQKARLLNVRDILATTTGGATNLDADFSPLAGRTIILWPDHDDAGKQWAAVLSDKLLAINCMVRIVDVAKLNLPPKGDCVDWLKAFAQQHGRKAAAADIWALSVIEGEPGKTDPVGLRISDSNSGGDTNAPPTLPEPLPALPDVLAFDYSYLPDALRGYVKDISERMQCPPDFAAVGVLVMMATIIGRKVGIRPMKHNDWTVICNLWAAVVGNSGVMKSPTLAAALSPIKKLQAAAYEAFNKAKAEHDNQAEVAKLQQSVNKTEARKKLKGNKSADVSGLLQSGETDDAPILNRYITNNASYEALGELLMENPNGLLVEADEIIGLLKQLDAGGQEVARSFYLTAADGDKPYTFDRIMRGKGLHIDALCLSIIGGIQPGVLAEYVRQATGGGSGADGLLQRFGLMVYPDISPDWREVDRYPDSMLREAVNILAERLDRLNHAEVGAEVDPYGGVPYLRFDDAAQVLFSEWRATLETRLRSGEEHPAIVSHLSKYRKLIPSLALINHLCDSRQGAVSEAALLRAIAFSEYLESHAQRIYSYATRPDIDAAKTLLKRLATGKLPDVFKARDVSQKGWAGLETPHKAQSAIDLLLEYHHLAEEEITTGGRPTTHYHWIRAGA